MDCALYSTTTTEFPVIRTTSEDTRILYFPVTGERKKRVAIVARNINEERGERKLQGTLTWVGAGRMGDRPLGWKSDVGAPKAASGTKRNTHDLSGRTCLGSE